MSRRRSARRDDTRGRRRARARRSLSWETRPRWRVARGAAIALGPGKADLLEAIAATGSISAAAAGLGMSYRRAWMLVDTMNRSFRRPLVATSRRRSAGAALTAQGAEVLRLYRAIEARSLVAVRTLVATLARRLKPA